MTIPEQIRQVQRRLGLNEDGQAGPLTWGAIHRAICGVVDMPPKIEIKADERSRKNIEGLQPALQDIAVRFLQKCWDAGLGVKIICGLRTFEEQDALYAKGRTKPGNIVTNARGGQSWHNYGLAFDIGIFEVGQYLGDSPQYHAAGRIGLELGLEWGGLWTSPVDEPHFQLRPRWAGAMPSAQVLAEAHRRMKAGEPVC